MLIRLKQEKIQEIIKNSMVGLDCETITPELIYNAKEGLSDNIPTPINHVANSIALALSEMVQEKNYHNRFVWKVNVTPTGDGWFKIDDSEQNLLIIYYIVKHTINQIVLEIDENVWNISNDVKENVIIYDQRIINEKNINPILSKLTISRKTKSKKQIKDEFDLENELDKLLTLIDAYYSVESVKNQNHIKVKEIIKTNPLILDKLEEMDNDKASEYLNMYGVMFLVLLGEVLEALKLEDKTLSLKLEDKEYNEKVQKNILNINRSKNLLKKIEYISAEIKKKSYMDLLSSKNEGKRCFMYAMIFENTNLTYLLSDHFNDIKDLIDLLRKESFNPVIYKLLYTDGRLEYSNKTEDKHDQHFKKNVNIFFAKYLMENNKKFPMPKLVNGLKAVLAPERMFLNPIRFYLHIFHDSMRKDFINNFMNMKEIKYKKYVIEKIKEKKEEFLSAKVIVNYALKLVDNSIDAVNVLNAVNFNTTQEAYKLENIRNLIPAKNYEKILLSKCTNISNNGTEEIWSIKRHMGLILLENALIKNELTDFILEEYFHNTFSELEKQGSKWYSLQSNSKNIDQINKLLYLLSGFVIQLNKKTFIHDGEEFNEDTIKALVKAIEIQKRDTVHYSPTQREFYDFKEMSESEIFKENLEKNKKLLGLIIKNTHLTLTAERDEKVDKYFLRDWYSLISPRLAYEEKMDLLNLQNVALMMTDSSFVKALLIDNTNFMNQMEEKIFNPGKNKVADMEELKIFLDMMVVYIIKNNLIDSYVEEDTKIELLRKYGSNLYPSINMEMISIIMRHKNKQNEIESFISILNFSQKNKIKINYEIDNQILNQSSDVIELNDNQSIDLLLDNMFDSIIDVSSFMLEYRFEKILSLLEERADYKLDSYKFNKLAKTLSKYLTHSELDLTLVNRVIKKSDGFLDLEEMEMLRNYFMEIKNVERKDFVFDENLIYNLEQETSLKEKMKQTEINDLQDINLIKKNNIRKI